MTKTIETERLILREWTFADVADMVDGLNNYKVSRNFGTSFPYTIKYAEN